MRHVTHICCNHSKYALDNFHLTEASNIYHLSADNVVIHYLFIIKQF